ncbi:MAG: DNA gyrase inhibitor YacG [Betaproteobacteria bacterium]|nr:MAG: DNA gyrase inhibitor YacG [Betaproteobacteria bacterium]
MKPSSNPSGPLVNCPQCGKPLAWNPNNPSRPFCSERCKMIDLGQWASEAYRIPADVNQSSSSDNSDC